MRLVPRSAAWRIAITSAAIFALSVVVIGVIVLSAVESAFSGQLDDSIELADAGLYGEYLEDGLPGLAEDIAIREAGSSQGLSFAVFSPAGRRTAGSLEAAMPAIGRTRIVFRAMDGTIAPARALTTRLPDGSRFVVAADLRPLEAVIERLAAVFAIGFAAVAGLGALSAVTFGRYLQRRLDAIARGSRGFAAGHFFERAEVGPRGDEFDLLAASLNAMIDRIEALLANLRQVTSDLAHDLRTPLTRLRSQLEDMRGLPGPEREDLTDAAIDKCDDILRIFAAILRISELEAGQLAHYFRALDLAALVAEIEEAHLPLAEDSGRNLVSQVPAAEIEVTGDRELLSQALINLVQNAINHTPAGTLITLGADRIEGQPVLFVRDDGPGICEDERSRATQRFVRLDASRTTSGHGLGLSMVKAIAQAHSARLELRDAGPGLEVRLVFSASSV